MAVSTSKEEWLARLVEENGPELLRFLVSRLGSAAEAEDLAQEVYLRLMRLDSVDLIHDPRAYAMRVAANVAYEWRLLARNRMPHSSDPLQEQVSAAPEPYDRVLQSQEMKLLDQALGTLSPVCRAIVLMHRRDRMTHEDIARRVGLSYGMVRKHLARGLLVCQEFLATSRKAEP